MTSDINSRISNRRSLTLAGALALFIMLPELLRPLSFDNNLNHAMGWFLAQYGRLPAIGSWDQNFPTINYIHAGEILLFGVSPVGFHITDILSNVLVSLVLCKIVQRYFRSEYGVAVAVLYSLMFMYSGHWMAGQRDGFATLAIVYSLLLLLRFHDRPESRRLGYLMIGLLIGIATSFRPTFGLIAVSIANAIAWYEGNNRWQRLAYYTLGGALAWIVVLLPYFFVQGALHECYVAVIRYNTEVYATAKYRRSLLIMLTRPQELLCDAILIAFLFFGKGMIRESFLNSRRQRKLSFEAFLLITFYISLKIGIISMGKYYIQHYHGLLTLSVILLTLTMAIVWKSRQVPVFASTLILILMLVPVYASYVPRYALNLVSGAGGSLETLYAKSSENANEAELSEQNLSQYLLAKGSRHSCIEIWGNSPGVYWRTESYSSSRFTTLQPLVVLGPSHTLTDFQKDWQREFMDSLNHTRPKCLVIAKVPSAFQFFFQHPPNILADSIPGFRSYIAANYSLDTSMRDWEVYGLK